MPTLRFLGHSACEVVDGDTRLLIDPFLAGNPLAAARPDELNPTAILISHGHNDHIGDSVEIAKRSGATVVAIHEIAVWFQQQGIEAHGMSLGGGHAFPWGWVKLTPAWHGSTFIDQQGQFHGLGTPAGLLVRLGGKLLYHAGDTALFGDMALIGKAGIDLALLPIGDNYTMGPDDALEAAKLLQPQRVVPIHYDTFPVIAQDAAAWVRRAEAAGIPATVVKPGDTIDF